MLGWDIAFQDPEPASLSWSVLIVAGALAAGALAVTAAVIVVALVRRKK